MKHTHVTFMESIMRRLDRVVFVRHNTLPSGLFDHLAKVDMIQDVGKSSQHW